jgi:hypothetical protein
MPNRGAGPGVTQAPVPLGAGRAAGPPVLRFLRPSNPPVLAAFPFPLTLTALPGMERGVLLAVSIGILRPK